MRKGKDDNTNTVQKLLEQRAERERQEAIAIENEAEFKKALNGVCATPNGRLVFRTLVRYCGIFREDAQLNPAKLIEDRGARKVYINLIRPYLLPENKAELEK